MKILHLLLVLLSALAYSEGQGVVAGTIRNLFYNVVGDPILHRQQEWIFEPDAGIKRASFYESQNGRLGELAIERIGLGLDGHHEERRAQQYARDVGHLGGVNFYLP